MVLSSTKSIIRMRIILMMIVFTIAPRLLLVAADNNADEDNDSSSSNVQIPCDVSMVLCQNNDECKGCLQDIMNANISWAGVTSNTHCSTILKTIQTKKKFCTTIKNMDNNLFCSMFYSCIADPNGTKSPFYNNNNDNNNNNNTDTNKPISIDCNTLTECNWPGIKKQYLGDGICHDISYGMGECYNTAICNYDNGDCCSDTCTIPTNNAYVQCGVDGYICRNPNSTTCDVTLPNNKCNNNNKNNTNTNDNNNIPKKCNANTSMYRVLMYDSFGDGWDDNSFLMINEKMNASNQIFNSRLNYGSSGTGYICLSNEPTCYNVKINGGMWGREISWDIRGYNLGSPSIASGTAPIECQFGVAGASATVQDCTNTCLLASTNSNNKNDQSKDTSYTRLKDMTKCIDDRCFLQTAACKDDIACTSCYQEDIPDSCYAVNSFIALTDCSICECSGHNNTAEYCNKKAVPGNNINPSNNDPNNDNTIMKCSATETSNGGISVFDYTKCTNLTKTDVLFQHYDPDNFGALDKFEKCATAYTTAPGHGDWTALACMQILVNFIHNDNTIPDNSSSSTSEYPQAIAELSRSLYENGQSFCDCSAGAFEKAPACPTFWNFKSLLYESIQACTALDTIDCDAWKEFAGPCRNKLADKYQAIDFKNMPEQCEFVKNTCGGVGPFPSFRRLDCENEVGPSAWELYKSFAKDCGIKGYDPSAPTTPLVPNNNDNNPPTSEPVKPIDPAPTPYVPPPDPSNNNPSSDSSNKRPPYVPPEERDKKGYAPPADDPSKEGTTGDAKKKSHWFRNLIYICILYFVGRYIYQRRHELNYYVPYQRLGGGGSFWDNFSFFRRGNRYGGGYGNYYGNNHNMNYGFDAVGGDPDDMHRGLALENSSVLFQPSTLPPSMMQSSWMGASAPSGGYEQQLLQQQQMQQQYPHQQQQGPQTGFIQGPQTGFIQGPVPTTSGGFVQGATPSYPSNVSSNNGPYAI